MCEEDISGAKPLRRQFLFHRLRVQRKFVPAVVVPGPAMGVLGEQRCSDLELACLTGFVCPVVCVFSPSVNP